MKNAYKLFLVFSLLFLSNNPSSAQSILPKFVMRVVNIQTTNPGGTGGHDSIMKFEVYLQQINQGEPDVMDFEYGAGQFAWYYNKGIQSAGSDLVFGLFQDECELPPVLRPPTFQVDSLNGHLKMSGNSLLHNTTNFFISGTFPGTKILTAKLRTSANAFPLVPLNLRFKLDGPFNTFLICFLPYTRDSVLFPNQGLAALTDTLNFPGPTPVYTVESGGFVLPVELSAFKSDVNKNNVTLDWITSGEINNQGFDIERSLSNSNEWIKAGSIDGKGNSATPESYSFTERLNTGHYNYRLKQRDFNGSVNYFDLRSEVVVGVPSVYTLSQNYPNPFNPETKIDFELPYDSKVTILLYDISGREVKKIVNDFRTAGYHTVQLNAFDLSSGMYFYRISAEGTSQNFAAVKKMILIK
ncbi:MAG: T9SS type A sorting domain-containing protein [Ignavibacteria bacterium]|nr:T9SS type A sorting domain-containing protein [Ignavibacteria bacterium]